MKSGIKLTSEIIVLTSLIVFISCGQQKKNEDKTDLKDTVDLSKDLSDRDIAAKIDTALFHIDTMIKPVNLNGNRYALLITKDKYDENKASTYNEDEKGYNSPISVHFFDYNTSKIIRSEKFSENTFNRFEQFSITGSKVANTFLTLTDYAGGSGYRGNLYEITNATPFQVKKIFDFGELSYFIISKAGDRIIKLDGDWNFDEGETHFSNHRYNIYDFTITDPVQSKLLGKTKQKYSGLDEGKPIKQILDDIRSKEPGLLQTVDLSNFVFR